MKAFGPNGAGLTGTSHRPCRCFAPESASVYVLPPILIWMALGAFGLLVVGGLAYSRLHAPWQGFLANRRAARFRDRFDSQELAERLGLPLAELQAIKPLYRTRTIPKRSGGSRTIDAPDAALQRVQERIHRRLLARLRVHDAAVGFRPGRSIADHARPHAGRAVLIKLDLVDFFPRTSSDRVERVFRTIGWDAEATALLVRLTTLRGGLPQGAPTSPILSNILLRKMDAEIDTWVRHRRGRYTRYADDLAISFPKDYPGRIRGVIQLTRHAARAAGHRVHGRGTTQKPGKLRVLRRHQRQSVCGLVVNEKVALPRERRRWLRAVEHRMRTGGNATLTPAELAGWRAFQAMVERPSMEAEADEAGTTPGR